jgi:hypothetical protein
VPGRPARRCQQRQAAQGDPGQDGRAPGRLGQADRVAEGGGAGDRADEWLQVDEGAGDPGRDAGLAVGEEGERCQRARQRQGAGGEQGSRAAGGDRRTLGDGGDGEGGQPGRGELGRGHGHRVAAGQQAGLGHGERGREEQRRQDQPVAGEGRAAAPTGGDQADAGQRHREAEPRHRARDLAVPEGGDDRDQHRGGPDEQGPVADAGAGDPGVLHQDRPAVAHRPPGEHGRAPGGAGPGAARGQQHGRGQAEPDDGEPSGRQPLQGELAQGHRRAPEQASGGERGDGGPTVEVHAVIVPGYRATFVSYAEIRNNRL